MTVVERIKTVCKARNIAVSKLESDLVFGNGYISSIKKETIRADRLAKISDYFSLPMDYLLGVVDQYGLTFENWSQIGSLFATFCAANNIVEGFLANQTGISEEKISWFFRGGLPLRRDEILNLSACVNVPLDRIIGAYSKAFMTAPTNNEKYIAEDDFTYAAHKYSGKLRKEDKDTIIKMMQTLAAANEGGSSRGEAD